MKTAVIGLGAMGKNHARILHDISDLVAVCDTNQSHDRQALAKRYGTYCYKNAEIMFKEHKPDFVVVAVPTAQHCETACKALRHTNVLVEKPMASTAEEADKMLFAAHQYKRILGVGHTERFNPVIKYLKEYLALKQILSFNSMRLGISPPKNPTAGVILDLAIHDIDIFRDITKSKSEHIKGTAYAKKMKLTPFEDHAHIFLSNGQTTASILANWCNPFKIRQLTLTLADEFIQADLLEQKISILARQEGTTETKTVQLEKKEPLRLELEDFIRAVRGLGESTPRISGEEGLETLKTALALELRT